MWERYWIISLTTAALCLAGCTATLPRTLMTKRDFVRQHEQRARRHESDGSLQSALQEWLIVSAVIPEATEPQSEITRLEKSIDEGVAICQQAAKAAVVKSDYAGARLQLLKALALQPENQEAIAELRKLEARHVYARLADAPKVSGNAIGAYNAPPEQQVGKGGERGNLRLALLYLSKEKYEAALQSFILARKHGEAADEVLDEYINKIRDSLAEQHYDKGVIAFRAARYKQAVAEFKMSLKYKPGYEKARLYLETASELQSRMAQ
jgi:hypothetical protein